jgi:hypothetical protein
MTNVELSPAETSTSTQESTASPKRMRTRSAESVGTVKCGITKNGPDLKTRYVEVTGTREVKDARLSAAINEYLLADRNQADVIRGVPIAH